MADFTIAAADVKLVKGYKQASGPAGEVIDAGEYCVYDATTGKWVLADASVAGALARKGGIAVTSANQAGIGITIVQEGIFDVGDALAAASFEDDVFLSDNAGKVGDAAGTVSLIVGRVVAGWASTTPDVLLELT